MLVCTVECWPVWLLHGGLTVCVIQCSLYQSHTTSHAVGLVMSCILMLCFCDAFDSAGVLSCACRQTLWRIILSYSSHDDDDDSDHVMLVTVC